MKLETLSLRPKLETFFKYFFLTLISLLVLKTMFSIFILPDAFRLNPYGWWTSLIILALGTSIGVTYGARRFQLSIADTDIRKINDWIIEFLSRKGLRIKEKNEGETTLQSRNSFNRMLNNWFGTEVVFVKQTENEIIVEGPFRFVNSIGTTLRFGKSLD